MDNKIKIGILGYGNLGKGVEAEIKRNADMELMCIITNRDTNQLSINSSDVKVLNVKDIESMRGRLDVLILCSGSAFDLPNQAPKFAKMFNTVDSFDTHAKIPQYFESMNLASLSGNNVSMISVGWDPGMFSINRAYAQAILPNSKTYTFWGKGVSQGHSNAIRSINGVKDAIQYTIPIDKALNQIREGKNPELTTRQKHIRECFVVLEDHANQDKIEQQIKSMPNYFDEYDTIIHFVSMEELHKEHNKMIHGGVVISSGRTGINEQNKQIIEYKLDLESNPEFTASVLIAYARATKRLFENKDFGTKTVLDIPPSLLTIKSSDELRQEIL